MIEKLAGYGCDGIRTPIRGLDIAQLIDNGNLADFLPNTSSIAIMDPVPVGARTATTHAELRHFIVNEFDLSRFGVGEGCRVAVLLPNGPEIAVCILSLISRWCAAPINATNTMHEIKSELESTKALAIVVMKGVATNEVAIEAALSLQLGVIMLHHSELKTGLFSLTLHTPPPEEAATTGSSIAQINDGFKAYSHPETVLLLHTSGTSGNKKCVPYSLDMILVGVGSIISSWNLVPSG